MRPARLPFTRWAGRWLGAFCAAGAAVVQAAGSESAILRVGLDGRWQLAPEPGATDAPRTALDPMPWTGERGLPAAPHRPPVAVSQLTQRWWLTRGRADVGMGLGTLVESRLGLAAPGVPDGPAATSLAPTSLLIVGMRYRTTDRSVLYADAVRWRGVAGENSALQAKVGVEFKSAQSRWNVAYSGLGMQLASDTKMTLRLRKGGLNVVMRRAF